jgi:hypothetical protein
MYTIVSKIRETHTITKLERVELTSMMNYLLHDLSWIYGKQIKKHGVLIVRLFKARKEQE